jgi:hypothetical protein
MEFHGNFDTLMKEKIIFSNFQYAKFSRAAKHLANPFSASALIDLRL